MCKQQQQPIRNLDAKMKLLGSDLHRLVEQQEFKCALTNRPLTPDNSALDHIVPIEHGGENTIENVQWLDPDINRMKGNLTEQELEVACKEILAGLERKRAAKQ